MLINTKTTGSKIEFCLFYLCLLLNIWLLFSQPFHPSYDGPAHLYYSRVINYMLSGNTFLNQYFVFNKIPVPNLADHYLLAFFGLFFSSSVSEKLLLLIYLAGLPICFRSLVSHFNPEGKALSILIFPLTHCLEFYVGGYNFCLSFVFMLASVVYYARKKPPIQEVYTIVNYITFVLLTLTCYFSNGIAFLLLGLILGIYEISMLVTYLRSKTPNQVSIKQLCKRYILFGLAWLPGLVCLYLFNKYIHIPGDNTDITFSEHLAWLYNMRPLFIYTGDELVFSRLILSFVVISFFIAVFYRYKAKKLFTFFFTDIFMLICLISLACFFIVPNGATVGAMCNRFCYYFFFFLILWIALQRTEFRYFNVLSLLVVITHFLFFFTCHYPKIKLMNRDIKAIQEASTVIKCNSVVLPISANANWVEQYFSFYLGLDKPLYITQWYEPDQGWFALKHNPNMPSIGVKYKGQKRPDYIFVYNNLEIALNKNPEIKEVLNTYYKLLLCTDYDNIHIYVLK